VKTVFVTPEENPKSGGHALLEPLPEANAIVSTGLGGNMPYGEVELPAVERVIGREDIILDDVDSPFKALSAKGQLATLPWVDFYGYGKHSLHEY
jgi:hypothetical protein